MSNEYPSRVRSRAKIISSIAELPPAIQGKICEDKRTLANGKTVVYHNLQYWADGRNHTLHIPEDKLAEFKAAARNGAKARRLIAELSCADTQTILSGASPLKKTRRNSPPRCREDTCCRRRGRRVGRARRHRLYEQARADALR